MCIWIAGALRAAGSRKLQSRRTTPATEQHPRLVEQSPGFANSQPATRIRPTNARGSMALDKLDKRERGRCQKTNPPHPERGGRCRRCDRIEIAGFEMLNGLIKPLHLIG